MLDRQHSAKLVYEPFCPSPAADQWQQSRGAPISAPVRARTLPLETFDLPTTGPTRPSGEIVLPLPPAASRQTAPNLISHGNAHLLPGVSAVARKIQPLV